MGNYVPNMVLVDGEIVRLRVRKQQAEMCVERAGRVAAVMAAISLA